MAKNPKGDGLRNAATTIMREAGQSARKSPFALGGVGAAVIAIAAFCNDMSGQVSELTVTNRQSLEVLREVREELATLRTCLTDTRERLIILETRMETKQAAKP